MRRPLSSGSRQIQVGEKEHDKHHGFGANKQPHAPDTLLALPRSHRRGTGGIDIFHCGSIHATSSMSRGHIQYPVTSKAATTKPSATHSFTQIKARNRSEERRVGKECDEQMERAR